MTKSASAAVLILVAALAGCSPAERGNDASSPVNPRGASLREGFASMDRLVRAAQKEGRLTLIGVSRDRLNFGAVVNRFAEEYGMEVKLAEPDASSGRQIEAAGSVRPDVFDLRLDAAVANADRFAPYRVTAWDDVPDDLKDPGGAWYAAYGGYMSIGYDASRMKAPASFADLLRPGVRVALPGDPLQASAAFGGVMAASLSDGRPQARRGVEFFAALKKRGALAAPARATAVIDWDWANLGRGATAQPGGSSWKVTVPHDAVLGDYYVQAINKDAPHPAAARLWAEFLYSDKAQNLLLKGYARPVRMEAMEMRGTLDTGAAAQLPRVTGTPVILTIPQADEAKTYLRAHWRRVVG